MQRLFSMFPAGMAGVALLVLRVSAAAALLVDGTQHWALVTSLAIMLAVVLLAILLCIGFLTPYCCSICCLIELAVVSKCAAGGGFHVALSIALTASVGMLGPGAYSTDSHLFGRRRLNMPRQDRPGI
jgi:hypothetical protein